MRKSLVMGLVLGAMLIIVGVATGASEQPYVQTCLRANLLGPSCMERLEFDVSSSVTPRKLPRHEPAPIALEVHGEIGTANGGHPSALREVHVDVDRDVVIDARGLPACGLRDLQRRRVAAARHFCRKAIVGKGMSHVGFALSGGRVAAPLTLFNGGTQDGLTTLFVHTAVAVPEPVPIVSVVKISKVSEDDGLRTIWRLPRIIDGTGSLLDFRFRIERDFWAGREEHSYVAARCEDDRFFVNFKKLLFRNEAKIPGVASMTVLKGGIAIPCIPSR